MVVSASRLSQGSVVVLACFWCLAATGQQTILTDHFSIEYQNIEDALANKYARDAETAFAAVTTFLARSYSRRIRIRISNEYENPSVDLKNTQILEPASRVRGDAKGPPMLRGRGTAIAHQIVHIVAPSRNVEWGRFLEEGLAVFVQAKVGGQGTRVYPNMGRDLHEETARLVADYGRFVPLAEAEEARVRRSRGRTRRLAFLEEGSFVKFLIETRGLETFMRVYDGRSFKEIYRTSIDGLEKEWRDLIETIRQPK